jgi:hypothetical protein
VIKVTANVGEPLVFTRDQIADMLEHGARKRRGVSARQLLRSYEQGQLYEPGEVADLLILADLLSEDDPSLRSCRDVPALVGSARELTRRYMAGGRGAYASFLELATLLLRLTVLRKDGLMRLSYGSSGRDCAILGGAAGPLDPLPLNDGRFLRLSMSLYLASDDPRGRLLKVSKSSSQYQADRVGEQWIVRYDYLREPGVGGHPQAHIQIRGSLIETDVLRPSRPLERVHFPTGRLSMEGVIRLLADQFGVPCNEPPEVWRPVLAEAEQTFLAIAHLPLSGPVK